MADPCRGYSVTTLKQFELPLLVEDISKVEISPSSERVSCLATDGGLWTLDCPSGESSLQFTNVADFAWQRNTTSDTLFLVKKHGSGIYRTHQFAAKFITTKTNLTSEFSRAFSEVLLIHCCEKLLVTVLDKETILCQTISSISLYVQWTFNLTSNAVTFHTLKNKFIFVLTEQKEIVCLALEDGCQVAYWRLQDIVKDDIRDFMFTADLNKLFVSTGRKLLEIECQGESWYNFSCLLGGSRYRNFRRVRKVKTIFDSPSSFSLGMYRGKSVICAGEKLTLIDKIPIEFSGPIIIISNTITMETRIPTFLQKDYLKVLYHGITIRSILQQVLEGKGSTTAETICKLNNWNNISMDLTVLQQGIANEHQDMVHFFFKTKLELSQSAIRTSISHEHLRDEFASWQAVVQEVARSLQDTPLRRDFSERLTKVIVSSIAQLLHWLSSVDATTPIQEEFVSYLCSQMNLFRGFLLQASSANVDATDIAEHSLNASWDFYSEEEVLHDAIQRGLLAQAQAYLRKRKDDQDLQEKASRIGQELVLDYILAGETSDAYKLMESLGWDIDEKLRFFFLYVKAQDSRVTILKKIMERPNFSEDLVGLLCKMEVYLRHYSCAGAKAVLDSEQKGEAIITTGSLLEGPNVGLIQHHLIMGNDRCVSGHYSGMVLAWLMKWDKETFEKVLLHAGTATEEMKEMEPNVVWNHMLKYAKMDQLEALVNCVSESTGEVFSGDLPNVLEISGEMLDALESENILPDVAESVRLQLAKKNLLNDCIIEDFPRLLNTLTKIKVSVYDLFDIEVFLDKHDYVHRMIHFCLAQGYLHFLHVFLMKVKIQPSCSECLTPLLTGIIKYNEWKTNPDKILDVTLAFSMELYGTDTAEGLWRCGRLRLASIVSTITQNWEVPHEVIRKLPLPLAGFIEETSGKLREDISMYQLLSKSTVFDTTKMFGFQKGNNIYEGEPDNAELPYFAQPKLVKAYGLKEPLTYIYYLLKYRVGCAIECFFRDYPASPKILKAAARQTVRIALNLFTDAKFVTCCVAFIESIAQESSSLRLLVAIGRRLLSRYTKQDLVENLCHVYFASSSSLTSSQNAAYKETAQVVLQDLDSIIREEFANDRGRIPLMKSDSPVFLQQEFSQIHQLEMSCTILELCAESNNWLAFIAWAQALQISRRRIMPILKSFSNPIYREHLEKALSQVSSLKDMGTKSSAAPVKRDLRASLYNKIGVVKQHQQTINRFNYSPPNVSKSGLQKDSDLNSDPDSFSVASDDSSYTFQSTNTQGSGGSGQSYPSNLIDIIVAANNSASPVNELLAASLYHWNPVPALIATHYNENIEQCFAVWLETTTITSHTRSSPDKTLSNLLECVENALKLRCIASLRLGYMIFMPDSVCVPLVHYIHGFLVDKAYFCGDHQWKSFCDMYTKDKSEKDYVLKILVYGVLICESVHEQRLLLRKYKTLPHQMSPNFSFFAQILESVADANWQLPFEHLLLATDAEQVDDVLRKEATRLINHGLYELAVQFSRAAFLPLDEVLCELLNHQFESRTVKSARRTTSDSTTEWETSVDSACNSFIDQMAEVRSKHLSRKEMSLSVKLSGSQEEVITPSEVSRSESVGSVISAGNYRTSALSTRHNIDESEVKEKSFWERAHTQFRKYGIKDTTAFLFFKNKSEQVESYRDKFMAMKYGLRWIDIEMHRATCWRYLLKCVEAGDLDILNHMDCEPEELTLIRNQDVPTERVVIEDESMRRAVRIVIDALLAKVAFRQAQFVSVVFCTETTEYQIAITAVQLAQGLTVRDSVPPNLKELLQRSDSPVGQGVRLSSSLNSEPCVAIEELSLVARSSQPICRRVLLLYLLASSLAVEYESIAKESDVSQLLRRLLFSKISNKFLLAKELVAVYNIEDVVLSSFIYREVQKAILMKFLENPLKVKDKEFDILDNFEQVVSLCKDATILGNRIFYGLKKDEDIQLETDKEVLYNEVELCILAHGCFSVACCMEGISHVLRHCHTLVHWLIRYDKVAYEKFNLMVRLLTGIGRYSEMSFIFDALNEHDHFEMLFQRGMEKVPHLKVALLDYLKKKKGLSQLDTMFKLNFAMHREIAEMNAELAEERIIEIAVSHDITWPDSVDLHEARVALDMVMVDLADAAEAFVKAECPMRALECTRKAELLALQIYYLSAPQLHGSGSKKPDKIISLSHESRVNWVNNHPVFPEARLVAEVYHMQVAWYAPLFLNVIVKGNANYLRDFEIRLQLTQDIVLKITDCYARYQQPTPAMAAAMEGLLEHFPDLETKYRCAKRLGFELATKLIATHPVLNDLLRTPLGH
ncbi:spatacsin-like [Tropilaelaps mercedesae]|uniref:Spatacsin-like n=1 Tax=Tropilaelaps mercedesae TaxID=418985 RepID=A0A1V9XHK5_9ACAR|nr:spatacsin-like [Tropilaelaps mercedesae]